MVQGETDGARFIWQKLVIRWALPDDRWPTDDDETAVNELARVLDPVLAASGLGEVNGFEHGAGEIDMLVFGLPTDDDVDELYARIAPVFRAHGCPAGSRIIRQYRDGREPIESDVVPGS